MEESVPERRATYECTVDGWRWRYELCPEKMIATGTHGEQYQRFQMDLKHSDPVPDHGETFRLVLAYPRWLAYLALSLLLGASTAACAIWLEPRNTGSWIIMGIVLWGIFAWIGHHVPKIFYRRERQSFAIFKRLSDGGTLLTLNSAIDEIGGSFEEFIQEVVDAINNQRNEPNAYSIQR